MNLFHLITTSIFVMALSGHPAGDTVIINPSENNSIIKTFSEKGEEYIPWTNERKLSWDDYLCEPLRNTDAVASTSTSLGIAYQITNGNFTYHITCGFSKMKSWGLVKTNYILAHEQGHFDITEIFARKLFETLQNYDFRKRSFKKDVNDIYEAVVKQKEEFQEIYDSETDHSRNRKVQYEWLDRIQNLLDASEAFADYPKN